MLGFDDGLPEEGHGCLSGFDGVLVTSNLDVLGLDLLLDSGLDQTFPILVDFESLSSHLLTNDSFAFFGPTQLTHNLADSRRLKFIEHGSRNRHLEFRLTFNKTVFKFFFQNITEIRTVRH